MSLPNTRSSSEASSDDESEQEYIPHSQRQEWKDVKPVPQDDEGAVATIKYSERFSETFDYFRAILHMNERSDRAFDLTTECVQLNAFNPTVWYYRRLLIAELKKDLNCELIFINKVILNHMKNYQVWHHRQWLLTALNSLAGEKEYIAEILDSDSKNYHCWQHRQWFVQHFSAWEGELEFTKDLIAQDIRNNAAWHHRFFVVSNTEGLTDEVIKREAAFTTDRIKIAPNNESSWNYLRGILKRVGLSALPSVVQFVQDFIDQLNPQTSAHVIAFKVDLLAEQIEQTTNPEDKIRLIDEAVKLCDQLATVNDQLRSAYWKYIGESMRSKS